MTGRCVDCGKTFEYYVLAVCDECLEKREKANLCQGCGMPLVKGKCPSGTAKQN